MAAIYYLLTRYLSSLIQGYFKLRQLFFPDKQARQFGRKKAVEITCFSRVQKKPDWVKKEIIHMKACMPDQGYRKLADSFNRRFANSKQMTVGKTYVGNVILKNQYEIQVLQKKIKHRIPKVMPTNRIWGIDLTGKTDSQGNTHNLFGVVITVVEPA